jgi:predicted amidophosphoribosyltransferase
MAFCAKCGNQVDDSAAFCTKCGTARAASATANPYRRASWFDKLGIAALIFFVGAGMSACGLIFLPVLPFSVPLMLFGPVLVLVMYRRAIKGPCPYCGAKQGPMARAFTCRNCKRRVLVTRDALIRVPD